ncbi:hypothetical protein V6N13_107476 [Hibiscus sabdariffa]
MDCDGHKPLIPAISYRDMLIGGPSPIIYDDLISLGDDDIDLLENDVRTGCSSGCPLPVQAHNPTQPPPIMNPAPPASIDVPNTKENATKVKAKGKVPLSMHKPPAVVLAPKNTNIMPRKSCSTLARSSRSTKERNASSTLNPAKHGALVMSSDSSHIALAKPSIKKNSSIVVQDNTQLNSTTAPPSTLEPITSGATSLVGFVPHLNGDYGIDANGCGHRNFICVTREYLRDHRPDVCVFVEPWVSRCKADTIIVDLVFPNSFWVEAIGFSEGI